MDIATTELFRFDTSFARDLSGLFVEWQSAAVPAPRLLALNEVGQRFRDDRELAAGQARDGIALRQHDTAE